MVEGFFSEVAEPIRFGGLDSTDPLTYKVYQPDRLVLGKRMEDHLRIGVCLWHSFNWPGSDVFGSGTFDRPWLQPGVDPMTGARAKLAAAFEFLEKLGVPYYCFHDRDVAPGGPHLRRVDGQPRGDRRRGRGAHGADRPAAPVGDRQPVQPPALRGRRGHEPGSRGLRLRRGPGQGHARGDQAPRRHELRPVGRPRGLRDAAQHRPRPRGGAARPVPGDGRRAQAQDRLRGHAADRAEAAWSRPSTSTTTTARRSTASSSATASRASTRSTSRPTTRRWPATASTTRSRTRSRGGIFGSVDANRGDYQNGWDTDQFPNSVDELSLAMLRDPARAAGSRPAASTSTPSSVARAWTGSTCSTPTSAASTRSPGRSSSPPT